MKKLKKENGKKECEEGRVKEKDPFITSLTTITIRA